MKREKLINEYGCIDYHYFPISEQYPTGLLLFMGSYVSTVHRRKGKFTELVNTLFSMFPVNTKIQVALQNKNLVPMFKRMGFVEVDCIEYWGACSNAIKLERNEKQ